MGAGNEGPMDPNMQDEIRRQLEQEEVQPGRPPEGAEAGQENEREAFEENPEEWPTEEMVEEARRVARWIVTRDETLEPEWWMTYLLSHELGIPPWALNQAPASWVKIAWAKVQGFNWAREEAERQQRQETRLHVAGANPQVGDHPGRKKR